MRYASYIGRVGGLAVALGVGLSIASVPVTAWAQTSDSSASSDQSSESSDSTAASETTGTSGAQSATTSDDTDAEPDATDTSEDEAPADDIATDDLTTDETDTDQPEPTATVDPDEQSPSIATGSSRAGASADTTTDSDIPFGSSNSSDTSASSSLNVDTSTAPRSPAAPIEPIEPIETIDSVDTLDISDAIVAADPAPVDDTAPIVSVEPVTEDTAQLDEQPVDAPTDPMTTVVSGIMPLVGLNPTAPTDPTAPTPPADSPMEWAAMAFARRQLDPTASTATLDSVDTSQTMLAAAAVTNAAPQTPGVTQSAPDPETGVITGSLNVTDPDGDVVTYAVAEAPAGGALTVNPDGTFTYTPTQLSRLAAGSTLDADFDRFTVVASDGQTAVSVPVDVEIYSGQLATGTRPLPVGAGPTAMATYGNRMYVANTAGNTVAVMDTDTGSLLATVPVGARPSALAVSPDGNTLYVANSGSHSVAALNTTTGAVTANIPVAAPQSLALSPDGSRLYVTSVLTNRVSVLNTATGATVAAIPVGITPVGVAVNGDGTRVYVANRGSGTVSAIDATTNRVIGTATVGSTPQQVALSDDGTRLYVANTGSDDVSVVDTETLTSIATVPVGISPNGITLSRDGSLAYVANSDNTVSVIDTATNTKVTGTLRAETGPLGEIEVSADGNELYVSNSAGISLRTVSLIHVDPPAPIADPGTGPMFEDFSGPAGSIPPSDLFSYQLGIPGLGGGGQVQVNTNFPENASLDGEGNLVITARDEPITVPGFGTFDYTGAYLTTQDKFEFTYGTLTARIKFPDDQGLHPAFWMVGSDVDEVGWPNSGEIDIFEMFNDFSRSGSGIHGPGYYEVTAQAPIDVADEFHEFWVRWEPDRITTGIDDQITGVFTPDSLPPGTPWTFNDRSMYVIMNFALGGSGGPPDATTEFPASVVVDWLRYTPLEESADTPVDPAASVLV
ncbi:beta-propeller fold lactonase family protein [Mycolicibacterium sp. XJ1819]